MASLVKHYEEVLERLGATEDPLALQFKALLKVSLRNLNEAAMWAEALNNAGVDSWEGIDEASKIYREMTEE